MSKHIIHILIVTTQMKLRITIQFLMKKGYLNLAEADCQLNTPEGIITCGCVGMQCV